jgi:hypothetical protein
VNGLIVTTWSSHCDISPYTGWVMAHDANTLAPAAVLNVTPNGSMGAIWMAGDGPAADSSGNFYALVRNGTFDTTLTGGLPSRGDYGNGILKISTATSLAVADYFEMFDTVTQSNADLDLGSGGAIVLPDLIDGTGTTRRLAVGAGKDKHIYVVNRDAMGKWNPSNNNNIYQDIVGALSGSVFSTPAYFNSTVYYGSVGDSIKAFPIVNGRLSTTPSSQSARTFTYPGTTPGISANGTANAILWAVENTNPAVLHAYDAGNLTRELSLQSGSH